MNFISAADLAKHLRTLVDDDDFITRTVRVHFPEYKKEVRQQVRALTIAEKYKSNRTYPDAYAIDTDRDVMMRKGIVTGVDALHRAIHREHPDVMRTLHALGKARRALGQDGPVVVFP